jgi:hypothetical protein
MATSYYPPLVLRYPPHEDPPLAVPVELQPFYTQEVWDQRLPALTRKASRYYKKTLELIWMVVCFGSLIAVPIAIYYVALDNLPEDPDEKKDKDDHWWHVFRHGLNRYWKARLISLGTWAALMILFFVPMHIWKNKGKKEVQAMVNKWDAEDRAVRTAGAPLPTWKVKSFGVMSKNIKFAIQIPSLPPPSTFHPAYSHPSQYVMNRPADPAQYYQQPPTAQWGPPGSAYGSSNGSLPLYDHQGNPAGGYNPTAKRDEEKEKNPFEDVKV